MPNTHHDTILLVCDDADYAVEVLDRLYSGGYSVVGPVSTAAMALALTAQSSPTIAVVARPPTGIRKAPELADELMRTWGVTSLILDGGFEIGAGESVGAPHWSPRPGQVERLRLTLEGAPALSETIQ